MPNLSNSVYDKLKWVVQIFLPALSAAYFALANIYDWSNAEKVVGTIAVITVFLGALLGLSSAQYRKSGLEFSGQMLVKVDPEGAITPKLSIDDGFETLTNKDKVVLQVVRTYDPEA
jgi:hypothetical protein